MAGSLVRVVLRRASRRSGRRAGVMSSGDRAEPRRRGSPFLAGRPAAPPRRFDEAEQAYHRALAINPERLGALVELAILHYSRRHFAEARQWIDSGMAVDSSAATTHRVRAPIRLVTGDLSGPLADAQASVRLAGSS